VVADISDRRPATSMANARQNVLKLRFRSWARSYNDALIIAEVILREHVAPRAPEPEAISLDTPSSLWLAQSS
jgi:hypothetical protein